MREDIWKGVSWPEVCSSFFFFLAKTAWTDETPSFFSSFLGWSQGVGWLTTSRILIGTWLF